MSSRFRGLAIGGWAFALMLTLVGLLTAVQELADGWVELPLHWWSTLSAIVFVIAVLGFVFVLNAASRNRNS